MNFIQRGITMLVRLAKVIYRTRLTGLLLALVIVAVAGLFGRGGFGGLKSGGFPDPASESSRAQDLLDTKLGGAAADVIVLMRNDTLQVTNPSFANAAQSLL